MRGATSQPRRKTPAEGGERRYAAEAKNVAEREAAAKRRKLERRQLAGEFLAARQEFGEKDERTKALARKVDAADNRYSLARARAAFAECCKTYLVLTAKIDELTAKHGASHPEVADCKKLRGLCKGQRTTWERLSRRRSGRRSPDSLKKRETDGRKEYLTDEEVQRMLAAAAPRKGSPPTKCRARALLAVLAFAGVRISEALELTAADVDFGAENGDGQPVVMLSVLRRKKRKADKQRERIPLLEGGEILRQWMIEREKVGKARRLGPAWRDETGPLFCTLRGDPMRAAQARTLVRNLAEKAGIRKRITPHSFRRFLATRWLDQGIPLGLIQSQLGHAYAITTQHYLETHSGADLAQRVRQSGYKPLGS